MSAWVFDLERSRIVRERLKQLTKRKRVPKDDLERALLFCRYLGLPYYLASPALLYRVLGDDKHYRLFLQCPTKKQRRDFVCRQAIDLKRLGSVPKC